MTDGDGDGDGYVTHREFRSYVSTTNHALEKMNLALWGSEGTTGIVSTLQDIKTKGKTWDRIITLILGILCSVITAYIIKGI